jgi:Tol biopolymer transport system component
MNIEEQMKKPTLHCAVPLLFLLFLPPAGLSQGIVVPGESYFENVRQLTFGGQNAEGYFSFDERHLTFQSTRDSFRCDQQYVLELSSLETRLVSTGFGKTTCGYFLPGDSRLLFSSTHASMPKCPSPPDYSQGYVWPVYPAFDIYVCDVTGGELEPLFSSPGYDAEATVSPTGERIVFTSTMNGDLDLYSMNIDGSDLTQLTDETGYDGGAFYSWDGKLIVYRAWHYENPEDVANYQELLRRDLVRPTRMELFVMNADGSDKRQITDNGAANFAPFFHPDNERIIFASNMMDPGGRNFDLFLISVDGKNLERVTTNETFDGFPMFTRDGRKLVFASNRNGKVRGETNLFLADWKVR